MAGERRCGAVRCLVDEAEVVSLRGSRVWRHASYIKLLGCVGARSDQTGSQRTSPRACFWRSTVCFWRSTVLLNELLPLQLCFFVPAGFQLGSGGVFVFGAQNTTCYKQMQMGDHEQKAQRPGVLHHKNNAKRTCGL